ncbi:hypothetical protein SSOG_02778 [Streptomyces himastatinicus ATCC 53653]|uniref:Uncharacterized protein n=1 Tax=Streptomyces himastatinicus ATCC 53653 TaxID=457427 RepID=D9WCY5_9ACTN|nr:hypothetical protein [Streptomyces himastatinicus]EFL23064.1 hypothetical protein SSOG_02778 [Streptomyces himastatinicus ATCC 53653]
MVFPSERINESSTCPLCLHYEALREEAEQAGDYSRATDYEVLRRRHPDHTVHIRRTPTNPGERTA